jgi:hypothetical protein
MKHALMVLVAMVAMISSTGCLGLHGGCGCGAGGCSAGKCGPNCGGCAKCGRGGHGAHGAHAGGHGLLHHGGAHNDGYPGPSQMTAADGNGGPATGAVTYPYYTTRGPRDFLMNNPPSIGR